ncbi:signal peptidase I [Laceyella sacchari]|uniref:Signal peptidase I n=1 Tax=Laceyella sediminis TaxID=573074 RepID=A0ABX5EQZ0_9BACL|nr:MULTISPECIES: signal peptidase I [Laceyella]PRZ14455.1 signal peptidase I [Laceyella sediminis]TCW41292.1 signal peptidase I [Laceyella sacchari]
MAWFKTKSGIGSLLGLFFLLIVFWNSLFGFYQGVGKSMEPALMEGEVYLVKKNPDTIKRGDIIVFRAPGVNQVHTKRVVAFGNETVEIKEGQLYINGQILMEPYRPRLDKRVNQETVVVPADHFFVLGDNRLTSYDSRQFGAIKKDDIIGVVVK